MVFLSITWKNSRGKYQQNEAGKFFWRIFIVSKSIGNFTIDRVTDISKIIDGVFLSMSSSINLLSTK